MRHDVFDGFYINFDMKKHFISGVKIKMKSCISIDECWHRRGNIYSEGNKLIKWSYWRNFKKIISTDNNKEETCVKKL